jgi:adenosylmethionine-8-amino-7-oxononanoate aminotransferase
MQNSPSPEELHAFDREHFLHPWHDMNAWRGYDNMLVEAAQGIYLYDETGRNLSTVPAACGAYKLAMVKQRWHRQFQSKF